LSHGSAFPARKQNRVGRALQAVFQRCNRGNYMKKLALVAGVVALVSVVPAHATATVPEPGGFVQLAAGLFVLGGLALFARKRVSSEEAE